MGACKMRGSHSASKGTGSAQASGRARPKGTSIESPSASAPGVVPGEADPVNELGPYQDALSALLTLGYKATDADQAIRKAADSLGKGSSTEELIRKALGR